MEVPSRTILTCKVRVVVTGGFDDLWENGPYDFGSMKATSSDSETELAIGREPTEIPWSMTTPHAGYVLLSLPLNYRPLIQ